MSKQWSKSVFKRNLRRYMNISGKNQKELAKIAGVTPATFNRWLSGEIYPRIDKIQILADYFGIAKSDLIEEKLVGDIPEEAEFHAKVLMDGELMDSLIMYYELSEDDKKTIRLMIQTLRDKK